MIDGKILEKLQVITEEEQKIMDGAFVDRDLYMENGGGVINSKKMLRDGEQIALRPHTRFVHFPEHSHDFVEIIYMCSGSTTHVVVGSPVVLHEGELLFLCQNVKHEIFPADYDDVAVNFMVCPEFFDKVLPMIGEYDSPLRRFLIECLKKDRASAGYLHFKVSNILPVQNLAENLICSFLWEPHQRNMTQITMGLLFLQLINHMDRFASRCEEDKTIVKVLSYIEENYRSGSLTELAQKLHYDISALSREIKHKTGKNYTMLVHEKRLAQACFLLKNTDMSIETIADTVGYKNVSFFHRLFKSHHQLSPKKYRMQSF